MRILFLHGWTSVPGGRKPTFLAGHGHEVLNPALPDEDFEEAVRIAQAEFRQHAPDVIVGSSRGGAVAMNLATDGMPLVLLCPAWRKWGTADSVGPSTTILHSRQDDVIPFADSEELVRRSQLPTAVLREVGADHRLADEESLQEMLRACERLVLGHELVDVDVFYLELRKPPEQPVPPPQDDLRVVHLPSPTVAQYRELYNAVGGDYYWLSRRKMSDPDLLRLLQDPGNEVHVLQVAGEPAGFAEWDRRQPHDVELVQFGLLPAFIGKGLGSWFLHQVIERVWSEGPDRFWLHTCSLDHPNALRTYHRAGFVEYRREQIRREL